MTAKHWQQRLYGLHEPKTAYRPLMLIDYAQVHRLYFAILLKIFADQLSQGPDSLQWRSKRYLV